MHLSALLDFDVVPLGTDDAVSVLLDVTAPEREEDPGTAGGLIAQEAGFLLATTAQAVSLRVPAGPCLRAVRVVGETPSHRLPDGSVVVELGDLHTGEKGRLLLRLEVPGLSALGTVTVAALEAVYVDPATLTTSTVTLPVTVNVVPGDQASQRAPRPEVRTEESLQRAQTAKREASEALRRGDRGAAADILDRARRDLEGAAAPGGAPGGRGAPPPPEVAAQSAELGLMARRARTDDASRTSTSLDASQSGYSRKRGRPQGPPGTGEAGGAGTTGRDGVIRGEQTDRGRPTPDGAAPGGRDPDRPGPPRRPEPPRGG